MLLRALALLVLALGACQSSEDDGSNHRRECRAALAHLIDLQTAPPPDADDELRARLAAHRAILAETAETVALHGCEARPVDWSRCVAGAFSLDEVHVCNGPVGIDQQGATP